MQDENEVSAQAGVSEANVQQSGRSQDTPLIEESAGVAAPAGAQAATGGEQRETVPGLEEMLRQAELAAQEHHDAWLRAKADAENIRKRAQFDIENARKFAIEAFAGELLAVKDALEAALAVENATVEAMKSGVALTHKQLAAVFGKFKLAEVNPLGEKFDPNRHQAIGIAESDGDPNTVTAVLQKGYLLNDRVLRPALVMVSKAKG